MKKIALTVLAVAALSSAAFAAGKKSNFSFENEISSDIVHVFAPKSDNVDSHASFAGVDATISMVDPNGVWNDGDEDPFYVDFSDVDWFVEFSPFKVISFGFSDELYTGGSYLPVWDGNINAGNYSTDGFSLLIRPIENLTFGAGFDFPTAWFGKHEKAYQFAVGADFTSDVFDIGGSLRHIGTDDSFQFGAYASLKMIDNLMINFGYTYSDNCDAGLTDLGFLNPGDGSEYLIANYKGWNSDLVSVYGKNIINAGVVIDADRFSISADLAFNLGKDDSPYDLYTAGDFAMHLTKQLTLDIKACFLADFSKDTVLDTTADDGSRSLGGTLGLLPKVVFDINDHHSISGGFVIQTCFDSSAGYTEFGIPVSWKYKY